MILGDGPLRKMRVRGTDVVAYELVLGESLIAANPIIGRELTLRFGGTITCIHCGAVTRRSYAQGHCYPCFKKLASCDLCVVSPDRCPKTCVRGSVTHGVVGKGTRSSSRPPTSIPIIRSAASLPRKIRR